MVSSSLFQFLVCLFFSWGHVHFWFNFTIGIHSLSPFFKIFIFLIEACWVVHHHFHLLVSFLGFPLWWSLLIAFLFLFFNFLGGGISLSNSSLIFDSSSSLFLDLHCGLLASLLYCCPPCLCSLILDKAC